MKIECTTIGELKKACQNWPDDKPLILDINGNSMTVVIEDWSEYPPEDIEWPVSINVTEQLEQLNTIMEAVIGEINKCGVDTKPVCLKCGSIMEAIPND